MRQNHSKLYLIFFAVMLSIVTPACLTSEQVSGDSRIVLDPHEPLPPPLHYSSTETDQLATQVAAGKVTGNALEQPIAFPHYTHATVLGMDCEYCHSEARKSRHAGVPSTQTCTGCHNQLTQLKVDTPEIQKVLASVDSGEPIHWKKVHDLPDFVYFNHKRHIRGGLSCTECHGQVKLQGTPENGGVDEVFIREPTLQMGWCLDCHASHPSIDENYQDRANLRRAELKDCWTCHM